MENVAGNKIQERDWITYFWNAMLWGVMLLLIASMVAHTAEAFGSLEKPGYEWRGWLPALTIDGGLLVITYNIPIWQRKGKSTTKLWLGFALFLIVSSFANIDNAMLVATGSHITELGSFAKLDTWQIAKVVLLRALLPTLAAIIAEINSGGGKLDTKVVQLMKQLDEMGQSMKSLSDKLTESETNNETLTSQLKQGEASFRESETKNDELSSEMKQINESMQVLRLELQRSETERNAALERVKRCETENEALTLELEDVKRMKQVTVSSFHSHETVMKRHETVKQDEIPLDDDEKAAVACIINGDSSLKGIAAAIGKSKPSASRLCKSLVAKGVIKKENKTFVIVGVENV